MEEEEEEEVTVTEEIMLYPNTRKQYTAKEVGFRGRQCASTPTFADNTAWGHTLLIFLFI